MARRVGTRNRLSIGVVGKVYLAHLPPDDVPHLLARHPLERYMEQSIVDTAADARELAASRERGYLITGDEVYPRVTALGAPV